MFRLCHVLESFLIFANMDRKRIFKRSCEEEFVCKCNKRARTLIAFGHFAVKFKAVFGRLTAYKLFIFLRITASVVRWSTGAFSPRMFGLFCTSLSRDFHAFAVCKCQCERFVRFDTESLNKSLWSKVCLMCNDCISCPARRL